MFGTRVSKLSHPDKATAFEPRRVFLIARSVSGFTLADKDRRMRSLQRVTPMSFTSRLRFSAMVVLSLPLPFLACSDSTRITRPPSATTPSSTIADAAHDFAAGFYWLPPMVPQPVYSGEADPALAPEVRICELSGTTCGAEI